MAQTFRIVLISEKSGKTYSVQVHPGLLVAAFLFALMLIGAVFFSSAGFLVMFQKHKALKTSQEDLQRIVQRLRTEHRDSASLVSGTSTAEEGIEPDKKDHSRYPRNLSAHQTTAENEGAVEVTGFKVHPDIEQQRLRVSFSLINKDGKKRISGYVFVVAQNTMGTPIRSALWPEGELTNDMPKDYRKGSTFSIVHRKQVNLDITLSEDSLGYNKFFVIVYNSLGTIIGKQEYSFDLSNLMQKKS